MVRLIDARSEVVAVVTIRRMEAWLRAIAGVVLVGFAPGLLAFRLLVPGVSTLTQVAVAPALGGGLLFLYAGGLNLVGLPISPATFAILVAVECLALGLLRRKATRPRPELSRHRAGPGLVLVGLAIIVGSVIWFRAIPTATVPPNHDSIQHGFMAARIAATGSVAPDRVILTDVRSREAIVPFYPVGLHVVSALAHRITGAALPQVFWALVVVAAALLLPIGLYCLSVHLFGDALAGGVAALVSVLIPLFPYKPIAWGGIALILGMALVPGVVVVGALAIQSHWSPGGVALAVLGLIGLLVVHTSEVPLALFVLALVLADGIRGEGLARQWRTFIVRLATVVALVFLIAVPIAGRAGEDRNVADNPTAALSDTLRGLLNLDVATAESQLRAAALALVGVGILLARRRPWLVLGGVTIVGLYTIANVSTNSTLRLATLPWYRQAERVAYNITLFVALFAGVAVVALARRAALLAPSRWRNLAVATVVVVAGAWVAGRAPVRTIDLLRREIGAYSVVGEDESDAFRYIAANGGRKFEVLGDEFGDGSPWMYAISGASPVFGMKPPSRSHLYKSWQERQFMVLHLTDRARAPEVDALLAKYCVGYVYYGERRLYGAERTFNLAALEQDGRLEESFRAGDTRVFRVKRPRCEA